VGVEFGQHVECRLGEGVAAPSLVAQYRCTGGDHHHLTDGTTPVMEPVHHRLVRPQIGLHHLLRLFERGVHQRVDATEDPGVEDHQVEPGEFAQ